MSRKKVAVDREKLDRAMKAPGVRSPAEAVDRALDELLADHELIEGLRKLSGRGGEIENLFDRHLDLVIPRRSHRPP